MTAADASALARARNGNPCANDTRVLAAFVARGLPVKDVNPRVNVLTYRAWRALGRQVAKGEHGVRLTTWLSTPEERDKSGKVTRRKGKRPRAAYVFHESQLMPVA